MEEGGATVFVRPSEEVAIWTVVSKLCHMVAFRGVVHVEVHERYDGVFVWSLVMLFLSDMCRAG